jgi:hypothetical protein
VETGSLARYGATLDVTPFYYYKYIKDSIQFVGRYTAWSKLEATGLFASEKSLQGYLDWTLTYWFKANLDDGSAEKKAAATAAGTATKPAGDDDSGTGPKTILAGIGIGYQNGDNPELGLKNTNIFTLSFQAKY